MAYNKDVIAKAKEIVGDMMKKMDESQYKSYIGSSGGFESKKEVEAAFLITMLLRTTGGSLSSEALAEILNDQYGLNAERSNLIINDARKSLRL
jgi:hypothetical protein